MRSGTDSYANATIQILGYLITKEIDFEGRILVYRSVRYADKFPIAIKQSREAFTRNLDEILNLPCAQAASLENAGLYQQKRSQLVQSEKMSVLGDLAAEVADKINNPVGLNAVNLQPAAYEVFHVRS